MSRQRAEKFRAKEVAAARIASLVASGATGPTEAPGSGYVDHPRHCPKEWKLWLSGARSCAANYPNPLIDQKESLMKISARNVLKGRVKSVAIGAVNAEVVIEVVGGTEIVSIITKASAEELGLKKGSEVYGVIKASNVMVAAGY